MANQSMTSLDRMTYERIRIAMAVTDGQAKLTVFRGHLKPFP